MDRLPSRESLRAYASRRWDLVARQKRAFVAERFRTEGPMGSRAAAQKLLQRWRELHPEGPLDSMRALDLDAHVALKQRLDKARDGLRRR